MERIGKKLCIYTFQTIFNRFVQKKIQNVTNRDFSKRKKIQKRTAKTIEKRRKRVDEQKLFKYSFKVCTTKVWYDLRGISVNLVPPNSVLLSLFLVFSVHLWTKVENLSVSQH